MARSRKSTANATARTKTSGVGSDTRARIVLNEAGKAASKEISSGKIKQAVKQDMKLFRRFAF